MTEPTLDLDLDSLDTDAEEILDESSRDETVAVERYDITSFGADYDVEGLVKRLNRGDIFIPEFQRDYVWNQKEASRFVESLLLGLPVPGIFLARETETNKLLVIDGQQRLKTLQFFYEGYFKPHTEETSRRVFKLTKVQPQFEGCMYETLQDHDRVKLNDSIIHATVVKQESPEGDDTSVYHIFERLNYGGRHLTPQEIRVAIYHGTLLDGIKVLNENEIWRKIFGRKSTRLKDQEMILRYFALFFDRAAYRRPMEEFLNKFAARNKNASAQLIQDGTNMFIRTAALLATAVAKPLFRPERSFNAAVFDSTMVGMSERLKTSPLPSEDGIRAAYDSLLQDPEYLETVSRSTADEKFVQRRITKAIDVFAGA